LFLIFFFAEREGVVRNEKLNNVFDSKEEFDKLNGLFLKAIEDFKEYRAGNVTYGEIMYVMECVLDSLRNISEKDARAKRFNDIFGEAPSFTVMLAAECRLIETLLKKENYFFGGRSVCFIRRRIANAFCCRYPRRRNTFRWSEDI